MTMPTFLIIGANKAGTTSLYNYLAEHPDIFMSAVKEPSFFSLISTVDDRDDTTAEVTLEESVYTLESYQALFAEGATVKARGEASTSYLYSLGAVEAIKQDVPQVKLIAILRNPVERAYSNYLMYRKLGLESEAEFLPAILEEEDCLANDLPSNRKYLQLGFYYDTLKHYYDLFDPAQIRIYLYEEWQEKPFEVIKDIFQFLEVDDNFVPDMTRKHNVSSFPVGMVKPPFTSLARQRLIDIYRDDILNLQNLLGKDLNHWLEIPQVNITPVEAKAKPTEPARLIAFYLPQYHPIPENDKWWGQGFTDWDNVKKAKSLFSGHHQPHMPTELGYYDLRDPAVREAQADLAKDHGIHGFCYYHYWFNTQRLLERPFSEVLVSGKPDFPFCLCWANENWTRAWDGRHHDVLIKQHYNSTDDLSHIRRLIDTFRDERYIRVDGKALFLVYRVSLLPRPLETTAIWREEAAKNGIELYLCAVESLAADRDDPAKFGFDASVEFQPDWFSLGSPSRRVGKRNAIYEYEAVVKNMLKRPEPPYKQFPCVTPGWDNSARRQKEATILHGSTPDMYQHWLESVIQNLKPSHPDENLVFINAWNEWAEGAHLEPDQKWDRAYLEATKGALENSRISTQVSDRLLPNTNGTEISEQLLNDIMSLYLPAVGF